MRPELGELFLSQLQLHGGLQPEEETAVRSLKLEERRVGARVEIFNNQRNCDSVCILLKGMAAESKTLSTGKRQILFFHVPGDVLTIRGAMSGRVDSDVSTLDPCTLGVTERSRFLELLFNNPGVARALWRKAAAESAVLRNRIVSLGRRSSEARLGHLLLEMRAQMLARMNCPDGVIEFPMTQQELADALGLSMVHVNRTLQKLRAAGLILVRPRIRILKLRELQELADFDGGYLENLRSRPSLREVPACRGSTSIIGKTVSALRTTTV